MIIYYLKIYALLFSKHLKVKMTYKKNFIITLCMELINQISTLVFIGIIFSHIPLIEGWHFHESLVIYGFALITRGIFLSFFSELEYLGEDYVVEGKLDILLTRPANPLFNLLFRSFNEEKLSEIILGLIALITGLMNSSYQPTFSSLIFILESILCGVLIYLGFFLIINSLAFWYNTRFNLMWSFMELSDFVQFPIDIFGGFLKSLLTWIIPLAFTSYYPATIILMKNNSFSSIKYLNIMIAILFFLIGYATWSLGLKRYESTGN